MEHFESTLINAGIDKLKWADFFPAQLTGHAKDVFTSSVPSDFRKDYSKVKKIMLDTLSKPFGFYLHEVFGLTKAYHATPGEVASKARAHLSRVFAKEGKYDFSVLRAVVLSAYTQECANFLHEKFPASSYELIIAIQAFEACHGNSKKPRTDPNKFAPRADKRESSAGSGSSGLGSEKNDCVSSILK